MWMNIFFISLVFAAETVIEIQPKEVEIIMNGRHENYRIVFWYDRQGIQKKLSLFFCTVL